MMIVTWMIIFIISLTLLILASEHFTTAAEKIGLHFGMPAFLVGITVVSIGTSLPELAAGIVATMAGSTEIVVGNVVGSNISNLFLVLGISALVATWKKPLTFQFNLGSVDMPLFLGSVFLLSFAIFNGFFSLGEAILFLLGYLVYILYSISKVKESEKIKKEQAMLQKNIPTDYQKKGFPAKSMLVIILTAIMIYVGASYTVDAILELSKHFEVGSEVIAMTVVAFGTSLPELSVAISAARRGGFEMALGNVMGSNIFNTFIVMAIPAFFTDLVIPPSILSFHMPLLIGGSVLVFLMLLDKKMTKWKGMFLILFYLFFLLEIFL